MLYGHIQNAHSPNSCLHHLYLPPHCLYRCCSEPQSAQCPKCLAETVSFFQFQSSYMPHIKEYNTEIHNDIRITSFTQCYMTKGFFVAACLVIYLYVCARVGPRWWRAGAAVDLISVLTNSADEFVQVRTRVTISVRQDKSDMTRT